VHAKYKKSSFWWTWYQLPSTGWAHSIYTLKLLGAVCWGGGGGGRGGEKGKEADLERGI
jgi:hypothetical protein